VDQRTQTVYALWLSGDDVVHNLGTGCNYSQIGPFDKAWVSTSTDGGLTWTANLAWQGEFDPTTNIGDNADKIFGTLGVDTGGQVHVVLPVRHNDDPVTFTTSKHEDPQETDLLLVTSPDQGAHWTEPVKIDPAYKGSQFFPWVAGGSAGRLAVAYYRSSSLKPNDPASKWFIAYSAVTGAVASASGGSATYTQTVRSSTVLLEPGPEHIGGICTFGIFCTAVMGNRNLADSIAVAIDPAGGANVVWTNDAGIAPSSNIDSACQDAGPSLYASKPNLNGCYRKGAA
jgi:hypothetical protein